MADVIVTLKAMRHVLTFVEDEAVLRVDAGTLRYMDKHIRETNERNAELWKRLNEQKPG